MMSIGSNPEYGAKHWLNSSLSNTVRNSNTLQAAGSQEPIFTTQAIPENGIGRPPVFETQAIPENGIGRPPRQDYAVTLAYPENGIGIPPQQNDPYYMVKSPWMNAGQNGSSSHASAPKSWYF